MLHERTKAGEGIPGIVAKWHAQMEKQYLAIRDDRPAVQRAYICSACTAPTSLEVQKNMMAARFYAWYAHENLNLFARAPHAYLPVLLSDKHPAERALALRFGLELLEQSSVVLVCGNRLSSGMRGELKRAAELGIPAKVFHDELLQDVREIYTLAGGNKSLVELAEEPGFLRHGAEELFG